jgi:hypothetical protein
MMVKVAVVAREEGDKHRCVIFHVHVYQSVQKRVHIEAFLRRQTMVIFLLFVYASC